MFTEENKNSWCVNAMHGMSANNDGTTKMCCMIRNSFINFDGSKKYNLNSNSIEENFNNEMSEEIRTALESGIRHPACSLCWQEEDAGRKSKRVRDNHKYFHNIQWHNAEPYTGLAKFELNLGNTCNIKCRTCNAAISSTWMKEDYELNNKLVMSFKDYSSNMKKYHQTYDEDSNFWEDLKNNLSTIKQFDFYGGEPFLSKKMWEILRICVEKGYSKDIELHYNTNGTTWPKEIELWENFKEVNLSFSIDGINNRFEYMRYPANWDEVKINMNKAYDLSKKINNMSISWCITLSSLNIYYLPEVLDEYYKNYNGFGLYLNLVHGPEIYNISKLPEDIKIAVINQLETISKDYVNAWYQLPGIIGFMQNGTPDDILWSNLGKNISKHDTYRKQSFEETFNEYFLIIKDKYESFLG